MTQGVISVTTVEIKELEIAINGGYAKVSEDRILAVVDGAVVVKDEEGVLSDNLGKSKELLRKSSNKRYRNSYSSFKIGIY